MFEQRFTPRWAGAGGREGDWQKKNSVLSEEQQLWAGNTATGISSPTCLPGSHPKQFSSSC